VHLVGFIIRIYHDARSSECQNVCKSGGKTLAILNFISIIIQKSSPCIITLRKNPPDENAMGSWMGSISAMDVLENILCLCWEPNSLFCHLASSLDVPSELFQLQNLNKVDINYFPPILYYCSVKGKGKAIPLQVWTDPEDSRRLRLPDFKTIGTWRW